MWFVPADSESSELGVAGRVEHVLSEQWVARYEVHAHEGRLRIAGLSVAAFSEPAPAVSTVVGRLAPERALRAAHDRSGWAVGQAGEDRTLRLVKVARWGMGAAEKPRAGRPRRSDRADARVAEVYVSEFKTGGQKGLITRVANQLHYTETHVRAIVSSARGRLLTRTQRGKAGGELTEYARWLLQPEGETAVEGWDHVEDGSGPMFEAGRSGLDRLRWERAGLAEGRTPRA